LKSRSRPNAIGSAFGEHRNDRGAVSSPAF
jgi:hypothetical protein